MVDRIKQIMEYYKLAPASFAEQIGINRSNLTHLFSGRNQPSLDLAKKILLCFPDIKTEWLIMGVGQMFRSNDERELNIQIQKEKLMQGAHPKPDLFSTAIKMEDEKIHLSESINIPEKDIETKIIDINLSNEKPVILPVEKPVEKESLPSHSTASIQKIVFFYSDHHFEIYHQK